MVSVSRGQIALDSKTISALIDTSIDRNNLKEKLVKNITQEEMLKEMSKNLKIIKEQNDEIIGDEFD